MAEVIVDIIAISILNIEILISLGHGMSLWDMGNYMKAFQNLAGLVCQDESVFVYLWPLSGNAMQIASFRKELSAHRIWRDDNLSLLIMLQEVP